jgi:hypothetical protein
VTLSLPFWAVCVLAFAAGMATALVGLAALIVHRHTAPANRRVVSNAPRRERITGTRASSAKESHARAVHRAAEHIASSLLHVAPVAGDPLLTPAPPARFTPSRRQLRAAEAHMLPGIQRLGHGPVVEADVDPSVLSVTLKSRAGSFTLVLESSSEVLDALELAFRLQITPMNYLLDVRQSRVSFLFLSKDPADSDIGLTGFPVPLELL